MVSASPLQDEIFYRTTSKLIPADSSLSMTIADRKSGLLLLSAGEPAKPMIPASLVKLIVTGASLEMDANVRSLEMNTVIYYDGQIDNGVLNGNMYLRGGGNCFLTDDDLSRAVLELQKSGINKVVGNLVADVSRFSVSGLERTRSGAGYTAAGALGVDLHTVAITVTPSMEKEAPLVSVDPNNVAVRLAVSARTVASDSDSLQVTRLDDASYLVSGNIRQGSGQRRWRFSLDDPGLYAAQVFHALLLQKGIRVTGNIISGVVPTEARLITTLPGLPLSQYLKEMNGSSLNVAADNLLLALGAHNNRLPATREYGLAALRSHMARHGVSPVAANLTDGSGLRDDNRITALALTDYLVAVARQPWFGSLYGSLPPAGYKDGSKGGFTNEAFRVKSGNLENVTGLAGYGVDKSGRELVFTLMVNSSKPLPPLVRTIGDRFMEFISEEVMQ